MKILPYYSKSAAVLINRIDEYFIYIEGEPHTEQLPVKENSKAATKKRRSWLIVPNLNQ